MHARIFSFDNIFNLDQIICSRLPPGPLPITKMLQGACCLEAHVRVLPDNSDALIGEHASNLQHVASTTGESISMATEDGVPVIVIAGPDPAVLRALDMFAAKLAHSSRQELSLAAAPSPPAVGPVQSITVRTSLVGQIIGVNGRVADSLLKIHGTYISAGEVRSLWLEYELGRSPPTGEGR